MKRRSFLRKFTGAVVLTSIVPSVVASELTRPKPYELLEVEYKGQTYWYYRGVEAAKKRFKLDKENYIRIWTS